MRRTKDDAEQTRLAILEAAEKKLSEGGISRTTLESISREAGVTRGAFYWHFRDKTDLLEALRERNLLPQQQLLTCSLESCSDDPLGVMEKAAVEALQGFEQQECRQRFFRIVTSNLEAGEAGDWLAETNRRVFEVLLRATEYARDKGHLRADLTPKEAAATLMIVMNGLVGEWLRCDRGFALSEFGARLFQLQFQMLRAPK